MIFLVTLSLFPGFTVLIPNYDTKLGGKLLPTSKLPTILIVRPHFTFFSYYYSDGA